MLPPQGEAVFVADGKINSSRHIFIVPEGVFFISAVVVSCTSARSDTYNVAGPVAKISRGNTDLLSSNMALHINGVGGGNGGIRGPSATGDATNTSPTKTFQAGGGAGGYNGDGGAGGAGDYGTDGVFSPSGSGGGGGGGKGYSSHEDGTIAVPGTPGGGVGLLGQGNNGASNGGNGSVIAGPIVGAGPVGNSGGDLRWKNDIPVTPGETLTIHLGTDGFHDSTSRPGCRIIWGGARSFPFNAGDLLPQGQLILTTNTAFTVPVGVISICVCCQQQSGASGDISLARGDDILVRAQNGSRIGEGGGDGGDAGGSGYHYGGGGAGSYTGDGGTGGAIAVSPTDTEEWLALAGSTSEGLTTGGSGSSRIRHQGTGADGSPPVYNYRAASVGDSIGIVGKIHGKPSGDLASYLDGVYGNYGGGAPGIKGGALAYSNNIAVTPGEVLTVRAVGGRVRIIYGPGRSYPDNAFDV